MFKKLFILAAIALIPFSASADVPMGDDGLHKPAWLHDTFLDLREDLADATAEGKRLALIIEQRGCIYCDRMHNEIFPVPEINAMLTDDYYFVQINMFGDLEITDFDGEVLTERNYVKKHAVFFTPSIMFIADDVAETSNANDPIVAVMPGAFSQGMTADMLNWVLARGYDTDEHFQQYHARMLGVRRNQ